MIKINCIGFLGKDCTKNEVNGKAVINFTVAHTEKWKDAQGNGKEKTTWLDCAYWTDKTGIVPYLTKGTQVYVEGTPDIRTWEKDGKSGASLTVKVGMIQLIGSQKEGQQTAAQQQPESIMDPMEDLPF